jgi:hypothetical protein
MLFEMKRLYKKLRNIWEEKNRINVFLVSSVGTGKSTFLFNFCRWINQLQQNVYAIYTAYPPSWGICKLYQYSLRWIGRKNFADAYIHCSSLNENIKKDFFDAIFLEKTDNLRSDPFQILDKLMRIRSSSIMSLMLSSIINMLVLFNKIDYVIFSIDNIENVWKYMNTNQKLIFLSFVDTILSNINKQCTTIMPLPQEPFFEQWISYHFPFISKYMKFSKDYVFDLNLQEEEYCLKVVGEYLAQARDSETREKLHPFTETSLKNVILHNTGVISEILCDAFNLVELGIRKESTINDKIVAEYYHPGKLTLQDLALKCPATSYKHGHAWVKRGYDYEKRMWKRTCNLCGITEESTTSGYRKFFDKNGKPIGEIQAIRR